VGASLYLGLFLGSLALLLVISLISIPILWVAGEL
jgi:hypothetical protein